MLDFIKIFNYYILIEKIPDCSLSLRIEIGYIFAHDDDHYI